MTKDELQLWMLIAFAVVFLASSYKIYFMFSTPTKGLNTTSLHLQLQAIIMKFIKDSTNLPTNAKELYSLLIKQDIFKEEIYKSFNENRFNQLLQQLFYDYEVDTLKSLIEKIHQEKQGTHEH